MICSANPVLTEDLRIVHKEECSVIWYMCDTSTYVNMCILDERPNIIIRDKPILSSKKMLHKDYYSRVQSLVVDLKGLDAKMS
jgi:hypothetical protein